MNFGRRDDRFNEWMRQQSTSHLEPDVIEFYPPIHSLPRLPPHHSYHVPPGYAAPDNLSPGHPGNAHPGIPDYPVTHPGSSSNNAARKDSIPFMRWSTFGEVQSCSSESGVGKRDQSRENSISCEPRRRENVYLPEPQVTFTDERVTSFLMLTKIQSSRLEQIHEGNLFGGQPSNLNDAPAYPRLM